MIQQIVLVFHLILALILIGLVLIQHGKGADAGAAFGSGASGTVFGGQGAGNFLTRTTAIIAGLLAITSISLTLLANTGNKAVTLSDQILKEESIAAPAETTPSNDLPQVPQQ